MIELNKRQYEILTFMANTDALLAISDIDVQKLLDAGLCIYTILGNAAIAPHAREMFRDAGLRRIN